MGWGAISSSVVTHADHRSPSVSGRRGETRRERPRADSQSQVQIPGPDIGNGMDSQGWMDDVSPSAGSGELLASSALLDGPSDAGGEDGAGRARTWTNTGGGSDRMEDVWPDVDGMQWKGDSAASKHPDSPPSPPLTTNSTGNPGVGAKTPAAPPRARDAKVLPSAVKDVSYSHYSFLTVGGLHSIPPEDVNYLESQGCLHIPTQPSLDDFVQHYFLHVHFATPIINEGDFWEMYFQSNKPGGSREKMSLLVFQAMLYASCNVSWPVHGSLSPYPPARPVCVCVQEC